MQECYYSPFLRYSSGLLLPEVLGVWAFGGDSLGPPASSRLHCILLSLAASLLLVFVYHLAFAYRDIGPVFDRMKAAGVEIVQDIQVSEEFGHKSFFVMAPDKLLIEVVEEKPIPEGIWED